MKNKYRIIKIFTTQNNSTAYRIEKRFLLFFWIDPGYIHFTSFEEAKIKLLEIIKSEKTKKEEKKFVWYPDNELKAAKGSLSICNNNLEDALTIIEDDKMKKLPPKPLPPKPPPLPKTRSNKFFL